MRDLNEGALLAGRYALVRRIGAGGMSRIWLADDRRSDSRIALKFPVDPTRAELLHKEWRIGSRLMHANIIRVFEYHDEPDGAFYGMQYINGPDISAIAGAPLDEVLRPIGLIADALRYAHEKNLIHRDIKAGNILLDARGTPYLIDFGVAAEAGESLAGGGSPISASPQQLAGEAPDTADDIYSLGVLMTELISGAPPRRSESSDSLELNAVNGESLPSEIQALINQMLAADAKSRPDASEVYDRLRNAGFAAGTAPARLLGVAANDDAVQTVSAESIRPVRRTPVTDAGEDSGAPDKDGVSSTVLYGGLAASLVLLLGVVFLLPSAVDDDSAGDVKAPVESAPSGEAKPGSGDPATEDPAATTGSGARDDTTFDENIDRAGAGTPEQIRAATDEVLGDLLSRLERLRTRGIDRWGGQPYLDALDVYAEGDRAFLGKDYRLAYDKYQETIALLEPFFDQIEVEFEKAMTAAKDAFDNGDHVNAVNHYDLAVAITPGNRLAEAGLARALNLKTVLELMDQALQYETDLELDAARVAFEQVLALDAAWQPATEGLARIQASIKQFSFDQRMTEGLDALAAGDYGTARAAFNAAKTLNPESRQPADGLLQVDQGIRLGNIRRLEHQAQSLEQNEEWESAIGVYEEILKIDGDLQFAQEGLIHTRERAKLHVTLNDYIDDPDALSVADTMQAATRLLLDVSRMTPMGPRLEDQKNTLSRLLKRAATPLDVMLISDNATDVALFRVSRLGVFQTRQLSLRPGVYVAVGSRPGYRDVRIEFRVAPEVEMKPIVVQCEEQI